MVQTCVEGSGTPPDPIATQLAAITAKLASMVTLKDDIGALKRQAAAKEKNTSSGSRFDDGESSYSGLMMESLTIWWDTNSAKIVSELPAGTNWIFDMHWYPKMEKLIDPPIYGTARTPLSTSVNYFGTEELIKESESLERIADFSFDDTVQIALGVGDCKGAVV